LIEKKCVMYADTWKNDKTWNLTIDANTHNERLILNLPQAENSCHSGGPNMITYDILCDPNQAKTLILNEDEFDPLKCVNTIKMSSKYACKASQFQAWYKSLGVSKYIVGVILGLGGLFFLIFGNTFFRQTSSVIIAFCSGIIIKSFMSPMFDLPLIAALILGCGIAWLIYNYENFMKTVLAIIIGYFIGTIMYNFTVKMFDMDPNTLYLVTLFSCIIIVWFFSYLIDSLIVIVATSLIGAYLAVRGLSICLGGFPDETYTSQLIVNKEFNQLGRVFGGKANMYLSGMLLLFIGALALQGGIECCFPTKKAEEEK